MKVILVKCNYLRQDVYKRQLTESVTELGKSGEVFISDALQKLKVRKLPSVDIGIRMDTGLLYMRCV